MLRKKSLQVKLKLSLRESSQKLSSRESAKDTLQDAPLVLNPVSPVLNREILSEKIFSEETLSVQDKVLACNTPEVDLLQHTGDQNLRVSDNVYVLFLNRKKRISDAQLFFEQGEWAIPPPPEGGGLLVQK